MGTHLLVPVCFERAGDKPVVRVDLHVAAARKLGVITHALQMLAAQGVGFPGACFKLMLDRQGDPERHRRHQLDEQRTDRLIDELARNRLADLSAATDQRLPTDIDRNRLTVLPAVAHAHALAAHPAQDATLQ